MDTLEYSGRLLELPPLWLVTFEGGIEITVRAQTALGARLNAGAALIRDQLALGPMGDTTEAWLNSFQELPVVLDAVRL